MRELTDSEWEIMSALWANENSCTLGEIRAFLANNKKSWAANTVQTFLVRLERKGAIRIDKSCTPHRYTAAKPRETYERREVEKLQSRVFRGSRTRMLSAFLESEKISEEELEQLKKLVEEKLR